MPAINTQQIVQFASDRFQRASLPQGTDRARFAAYISSMGGAIGAALDLWRLNARLEGVTIMGPAGTGGKLFSEVNVETQILQRAPAGWDAYSRAIAAGVHNQFKSFANDVKVPGLPMWPAFAAFPLAHTPPIPNVPVGLLPMAAVASRHLKEGTITDMIYNKMPSPKPACCKDVAIALAFGIEKAALLWLGLQQVTLVMGHGPVPTWAPPVCPVGPVVRGSVLPNGRHLVA